MPQPPPNFSPFPFHALRRISRADAALESACARWSGARPLGKQVAALGLGAVRARIVGVTRMPFDPNAAHAEVRIAGASIVVACASRPLRALAQATFGGPVELLAPRALTSVEQALWVVVVAAALEDTSTPGEVWPSDGLPAGATIAREPHGLWTTMTMRGSGKAPVYREGARILAPRSAPSSPADVTKVAVAGARTIVETPTLVEAPLPLAPTVSATPPSAPSSHIAIELVIEQLGGEQPDMRRLDDPTPPWTVIAYVPRALEVRVPPSRPLPAWELDVPVVLGRCVVDRAEIGRLRVRDVVTVDRAQALVVGAGTVPIAAVPGAVEARVVTGYVPAPMSNTLADAAQVELTVQLGTLRMSLREIGELAPGVVVSLGKPLAGPYEVRAAGRLIGRGELVDVDGELGVRIVSLEE